MDDEPHRRRIRGNAPDARIVRTGDLLGSALLTLLERKSLDQITIREITAEAGVSYATFFRHHAAKDELLQHVAADQMDTLVALTVPVLDATDSRSAFRALCTYVEDHRTLWTALLTGGAAATMRSELLRLSRAVATDRASLNAWLPVELGVSCTVGLIIEVVTWWLAQPADMVPIDEVADILDRLVISSSILLTERLRPA